MLALMLGAAACSEPTAPDATVSAEPRGEAASVDPAGQRRLVLMTQNPSVGADVHSVLLAVVTLQADDDLPGLIAAIDTLQRTAFTARAAALAAEIDEARPDAVGLQEVSTIEILLPPLG